MANASSIFRIDFREFVVPPSNILDDHALLTLGPPSVEILHAIEYTQIGFVQKLRTTIVTNRV